MRVRVREREYADLKAVNIMFTFITNLRNYGVVSKASLIFLMTIKI